jgi:hypothetical protein
LAEGIVEAIKTVHSTEIPDIVVFTGALNDAIDAIANARPAGETTHTLSTEDTEVENLFNAARKSEARGWTDALKAGGLKFAILAFCEFVGEKLGLREGQVSYLQEAIIEKLVELMPQEKKEELGTHTKRAIEAHNAIAQQNNNTPAL